MNLSAGIVFRNSPASISSDFGYDPFFARYCSSATTTAHELFSLQIHCFDGKRPPQMRHKRHNQEVLIIQANGQWRIIFLLFCGHIVIIFRQRLLPCGKRRQTRSRNHTVIIGIHLLHHLVVIDSQLIFGAAGDGVALSNDDARCGPKSAHTSIKSNMVHRSPVSNASERGSVLGNAANIVATSVMTFPGKSTERIAASMVNDASPSIANPIILYIRVVVLPSFFPQVYTAAMSASNPA